MPEFRTSAFFVAHRVLSAVTIAVLQAADNRRFGFFAIAKEDLAAAFCSAHRRRWAAAIARRRGGALPGSRRGLILLKNPNGAHAV